MSMMTLSMTAVRSRRLPRWSELESAFIEWRQRAHSRRELMALGQRDLWDIGLSRADAAKEASKPFWER